MNVDWLIDWLDEVSTVESCNQITFSIYELLFINLLSRLDICASQTFSSDPGNLVETLNNQISGGTRGTIRKRLSVSTSLISTRRLREQSFALTLPAKFCQTLRWSQCSELWEEMEEQISPSSVQPLMTQQQPLPKGEAMQGWTVLRAPAGFEIFVWRLPPVASSFRILVFFPFPKPPQMWLTGRIILASSSASQTAPPWRRPSLSGEIRAVRCHDGVQWHTELSRTEAEEYEIQNGALFSI